MAKIEFTKTIFINNEDIQEVVYLALHDMELEEAIEEVFQEYDYLDIEDSDVFMAIQRYCSTEINAQLELLGEL